MLEASLSTPTTWRSLRAHPSGRTVRGSLTHSGPTQNSYSLEFIFGVMLYRGQRKLSNSEHVDVLPLLVVAGPHTAGRGPANGAERDEAYCSVLHTLAVGCAARVEVYRVIQNQRIASLLFRVSTVLLFR